MGSRIMGGSGAWMAVALTTSTRAGMNHHHHHHHHHHHNHNHNRLGGGSRTSRVVELGEKATRWRYVNKNGLSCCKAVEQTDTTTYQGIYGPWTIEPSDVREVVLYRSGLVVAAASFVVNTCTAFLPDHSLLKHYLDLFYFLGAAGLGLSLYLIHIYVTEIKRTLQALWFFGVFGSLATYFTLARPAGLGLVQYVVDNPTAVWFVGPIFASLTGLVIKEGLCYGKLEAAILAFIIPTCLLGHLSGAMDNGVKTCLMGVWVALFVIFSGRKFTQPLKDDIGDKSVFMFKDLSEEEKAAVLDKSERQKS